jgi:hypothetical protein
VEVNMKRAAMVSGVFGVLVVAAALPIAMGDSGPSYAADIEPVFVKRCGKCHGADESKADLVLDPGRGFAMLVGRASTQVPEKLLVEPGSTEGSYLWSKLTHTSEVGKGMPRTLFGAKRIPQAELELVRSWIEAGAQP